MADERQRQRAFSRARRNTLFVRMMRFVLPLAAVALLSTYALFMQHKIRIETGSVVGTLDTGTLSGTSFENFTMQRPSYQGYDRKNGSRYRIEAERAVTDLSPDKPIELTGIAGRLEQADGRTTSVTAARGVFDQKKRTLELDGGITVAAPNDLGVRLNHAVVDAASQRIVSDAPVTVTMPAGSVRGNAMDLDQRARRVIFSKGVEARLNPSVLPPATPAAATPRTAAAASTAKAAPPTASKSAGPTALTASRDPVDITAATLEVSQTERRARFDGNVRAVQAGRTLETTRLTVLLAESATLPGLPQPAAPSADKADNTGKPDKSPKGAGVRELVAEDGVVLTDGPNRVTARRAIFDVAANQARLSGGIRIDGRDGASIEAETAMLEARSGRVSLAGSVVARREGTLLRGTRLDYERETAHLRLTAPAAPGNPEGRVFARLTPPSARQSRRVAKPRPAAATGFTFSTNPDAPIEITATALDVADTRSAARFEGGVRARQGDFVLTTPTLVANYAGRLGLDGSTPSAKARNALRTITASGPVEVTSGNDVTATGQRALYDVAAEKVTLTGNVVLRQGRQIVRGETLSIDLKTGLARVQNAAPANNATKHLVHGPAPRITADPKQRDCGGQMCAVFFPRDVRQRPAPGVARTAPARPRAAVPSVGSGWSTSTPGN
jgi:LPS export ABC transporter protein LptC/lipopolysaccharide transport protein LptA